MKTGNVLLLGGAAFALYYLAQLGVAAATVNFVFQGVDFQSVTNWNLKVIVQNVSNAAIKLYAMSGTAYVNGNSLGNVSYFPSEPTEIAPASQQLINFNANLSLITLPATIQNLINNPSPGGVYNFEIQGNANVNTLVVPFDLKLPLTT